MSNLVQRSITGILFVAVLLGSMIYGPISFLTLFLFICVLGCYEFFKLSNRDNIKPAMIAGSFIGGAVFLISSFTASGLIDKKYLFLCIPLLFLVFVFEFFSGKVNPFTNIAFTLLGIIYVAVPFSLLPFLTYIHGEFSNHLLIGYFLILWSSDTGAYIIGRSFGKHKLAERISPKKTWEGSFGGTLSALLVSYFISNYYSEYSLTNWLVMAIIIVVTGTLGDLTESLFKRSINIKDSGSILPGHGGILDRFDALLLSMPFVFAYIVLTN